MVPMQQHDGLSCFLPVFLHVASRVSIYSQLSYRSSRTTHSMTL
jgi:hypothetical protein